MLAEEIAEAARLYIQCADQTVVDDALLAQWLERAYDDFRCIVIDIDPYVYALSRTYTLNNARTLDLAGTILGAAVAQDRLYQLVNIYLIESVAAQDNVIQRLRPSNALQSSYDGRADYTLKGTVLHFGGEVNGDIRVDYIPQQAINWPVAMQPAANVYVDDLTRFHDLIALITYLQYAVLDVSENAPELALLMRRQEQLRTYLENRAGGVIESVVDVNWMS